MVPLTKNKTISVLGCGWFGLALAKQLVNLNFDVKGSTTSLNKLEVLKNAGISPFLLDFKKAHSIESTSFFDADILFVCIPPKRNSTEFLDYTDKIKTIISLARNRSRQLIFISSTSVYGDVNKTVDENTQPVPDSTSGELMLKTEKIILQEPNHTIIRFSGLFGPERDPGRFFAGKVNIPNGLAPVNLIYQDDAVGIALAILEKETFGKIYNACSPDHPNRNVFYTSAAQKSGLTEPHFLAEKKAWKIVDSVHVPQFLNYEFKWIYRD